jgi:hypothetical protein
MEPGKYYHLYTHANEEENLFWEAPTLTQKQLEYATTDVVGVPGDL